MIIGFIGVNVFIFAKSKPDKKEEDKRDLNTVQPASAPQSTPSREDNEKINFHPPENEIKESPAVK